jgi:hypothetical protein
MKRKLIIGGGLGVGLLVAWGLWLALEAVREAADGAT